MTDTMPSMTPNGPVDAAPVRIVDRDGRNWNPGQRDLRDDQGVAFNSENGTTTTVYVPSRASPTSITETNVQANANGEVITRRRTTTLTADTVTESGWVVIGEEDPDA